MKLIMPDYCENFKCSADKCGDNCCIGWGIYIDDNTLKKYDSIEGEFGSRLRNSIDHEEQCFINDDTHRCPFLNENNLCDIIITLGEDHLCHICDRHPRYFEWLNNEIEGGIGLCCEEAAKLILGAQDFKLTEKDAPENLIIDDDEEYDELYYKFLKKTRQKIIALLLDETVPLEIALGIIGGYGMLLQDMTDTYEIAEIPEIECEYIYTDIKSSFNIISNAEPVDNVSPEYFVKINEFLKNNETANTIYPENERELRNIAVYFIWRYYMKAALSGDLYPKIMTAIFSTEAINVMFNYEKKVNGELTFEKKCNAAKIYSKLMEYSEENLQLIYDNYEFF